MPAVSFVCDKINKDMIVNNTNNNNSISNCNNKNENNNNHNDNVGCTTAAATTTNVNEASISFKHNNNLFSFETISNFTNINFNNSNGTNYLHRRYHSGKLNVNGKRLFRNPDKTIWSYTPNDFQIRSRRKSKYSSEKENFIISSKQTQQNKFATASLNSFYFNQVNSQEQQLNNQEEPTNQHVIHKEEFLYHIDLTKANANKNCESRRQSLDSVSLDDDDEADEDDLKKKSITLSSKPHNYQQQTKTSAAKAINSLNRNKSGSTRRRKQILEANPLNLIENLKLVHLNQNKINKKSGASLLVLSNSNFRHFEDYEFKQQEFEEINNNIRLTPLGASTPTFLDKTNHHHHHHQTLDQHKFTRPTTSKYQFAEQITRKQIDLHKLEIKLNNFRMQAQPSNKQHLIRTNPNSASAAKFSISSGNSGNNKIEEELHTPIKQQQSSSAQNSKVKSSKLTSELLAAFNNHQQAIINKNTKDSTEDEDEAKSNNISDYDDYEENNLNASSQLNIHHKEMLKNDFDSVNNAHLSFKENDLNRSETQKNHEKEEAFLSKIMHDQQDGNYKSCFYNSNDDIELVKCKEALQQEQQQDEKNSFLIPLDEYEVLETEEEHERLILHDVENVGQNIKEEEVLEKVNETISNNKSKPIHRVKSAFIQKQRQLIESNPVYSNYNKILTFDYQVPNEKHPSYNDSKLISLLEIQNLCSNLAEINTDNNSNSSSNNSESGRDVNYKYPDVINDELRRILNRYDATVTAESYLRNQLPQPKTTKPKQEVEQPNEEETNEGSTKNDSVQETNQEDLTSKQESDSLDMYNLLKRMIVKKKYVIGTLKQENSTIYSLTNTNALPKRIKFKRTLSSGNTLNSTNTNTTTNNSNIINNMNQFLVPNLTQQKSRPVTATAPLNQDSSTPTNNISNANNASNSQQQNQKNTSRPKTVNFAPLTKNDDEPTNVNANSKQEQQSTNTANSKSKLNSVEDNLFYEPFKNTIPGGANNVEWPFEVEFDNRFVRNNSMTTNNIVELNKIETSSTTNSANTNIINKQLKQIKNKLNSLTNNSGMTKQFPNTANKKLPVINGKVNEPNSKPANTTSNSLNNPQLQEQFQNQLSQSYDNNTLASAKVGKLLANFNRVKDLEKNNVISQISDYRSNLSGGNKINKSSELRRLNSSSNLQSQSFNSPKSTANKSITVIDLDEANRYPLNVIDHSNRFNTSNDAEKYFDDEEIIYLDKSKSDLNKSKVKLNQEDNESRKSITIKNNLINKFKIDPKKTRILLTTRIQQNKSVNQQAHQNQQQQQKQHQASHLQPIDQQNAKSPNMDEKRRVQSSNKTNMSSVDCINFKTSLLSLQHQDEIYSLIGSKKATNDTSSINIDIFRQNGMFSLKSSITNENLDENKRTTKLLTDALDKKSERNTLSINKASLIFSTKSNKRPKTSKT